MRVRALPTKKYSGQVMSEYIIASIFMGLFVWYAIVGGSVDPVTGRGGLQETDASIQGSGVYYDKYHNNSASVRAPGLVQALHKKQKDFSNEIYKP